MIVEKSILGNYNKLNIILYLELKVKLFKELKDRAKSLKKEITAIYYAYKNPKTKLLPKILIFLTLGYALSPIDFIPDFIPFFGYLDDFVIIPLMIMLSIKLIPEEIMNESREKALKEPLVLKKNWGFALVFIFIWIILLAFLLRIILKLLLK